jgi:chemotaxis protein CheD
LHPGDVVCAERGERLETLLGSCVAIMLTDPRRTIGTMCHIVHSTSAAGRSAESSSSARIALPRMYELLQARGINPALCDAYIVGGGNMFPDLYANNHVGERNVSWALETLGRHGVHVLLHDVGGSAYRRVAWTVGPGAPQVTAIAI